MAMPTFVSVGAVASGTGAITVNPGASRVAGDIDILLVQTAGGASSLTTANGFAAVTGLNQVSGSETTGCRVVIYWRRWNGSAGSPVTNDSGDHQLARMVSYRGVKDTGDPWNTVTTGTTDTSADTSVSAAGGTTTASNCMILAFCGQDDPDSTSTAQFGTATNASLSSITERIDNSTTSGTGGAIWLVEGQKATAGSYNATTCTAATSAAPRLCGTIALEGAPDSPSEGATSGAVSWVGAVDGTTVKSGSASGSVGWIGSVDGVAVHQGSAAGAVGWVGSVDGEAPVVVMDGEVNGAIAWAGTVTGLTVHLGDVAGWVSWAGAADGEAVHQGSTSGAISWTGTTTGAVDHEGSAAGTIGWAGTVNGESPGVGVQEGSAEGAIGWVGGEPVAGPWWYPMSVGIGSGGGTYTNSPVGFTRKPVGGE